MSVCYQRLDVDMHIGKYIGWLFTYDAGQSEHKKSF